MNLSLVDKKKYHKPHIVYSHGIGDKSSGLSYHVFGTNDLSVPEYPWTCFYTKRAVHILANRLYEKVIEQKKQSILLEGFSCGAGTAINCLNKLIHYDESYFEGSIIRSKKDANTIIRAINNGGLVISDPLLSLYKTTHVELISHTLMAETLVLAYLMSRHSFPDQYIRFVGLAAAGAMIQKAYEHGLVYVGAPLITSGHYNPFHEDPIDAIGGLQGKLTCPILLHFNGSYGPLKNYNTDKIKVYEALYGNKTHILISKEGSHNVVSPEFEKLLKNFCAHYFMGDTIDLSRTQLTVDELKKSLDDENGLLSLKMKQDISVILFFALSLSLFL